MLEFLRFKERLAASHAHAEAYTEIAALALGSPTAQVPASAVQEAAAKAAAQLQVRIKIHNGQLQVASIFFFVIGHMSAMGPWIRAGIR